MQIEEALSLMEQQMQKVSDALLGNDPDHLQVAASVLRDASAEFAQIAHAAAQGRGMPDAVIRRMELIAAQLSAHREGLARLVAMTDRQVGVLLPQDTGASTYGSGLGGRVAGVAGRLYRSTG